MEKSSSKEAMVTIVIPVYNRESLIARCLDSVRAQTHRPLEVIVVDNNSTDSTLEKVRDWVKENEEEGFDVQILSQAKPGASAARNVGLECVTTPFTLFFDSDDEMHPELVESALKACGEADLVFWKAHVVKVDGTEYQKPYHTDNLLIRQFFNSILSTQTYMARTRLFRQAGGWNEDARVWNDWELGIRIALQSPRYVALPRDLVTIYAQEESITGKRLHDKAGEWEHTVSLVRRYLDNKDFEVYKPVLDYVLTVVAARYYKEGFREASHRLLMEICTDKSHFERKLLKLIYHYTKRGGRGGYYIWLLMHRGVRHAKFC